MKNKKYYIALNDREYAEIISSLIYHNQSITNYIICEKIIRPSTLFLSRRSYLLYLRKSLQCSCGLSLYPCDMSVSAFKATRFISEFNVLAIC